MKLVEKCRDLYGTLSQSQQELIEKMLLSPSEGTWELARRIVISPTPVLTLDMAVKRVSTSSEKIPSSFTIYRAIRYATEKHEQFKALESARKSEAG